MFLLNNNKLLYCNNLFPRYNNNERKVIIIIKKKPNSFINFLYVISLLIVASLVIGIGVLAIIFVISGIVYLFIPSARSGVFHDIISGIGGSTNIWIILLSMAFLIIILGSMALISFSVLKLISDVRQNIYFKPINLKHIRGILLGYGIMILTNYCSGLLSDTFNINSSSISSDQGNSGVSILLWFAFYVIYVIFKYGIELQEDSDKIV